MANNQQASKDHALSSGTKFCIFTSLAANMRLPYKEASAPRRSMKTESENSKRSMLDKAAVVLSSICMAHCLALPFLLTIAPITQGAFLDEQVFHLLMLVVILPVSLIALTIGCRKHKDALTMILGVIGLLILSMTAVFGHDWFGITGERLVTSLGGLVLAGAHIQNYRICRSHDCLHDH